MKKLSLSTAVFVILFACSKTQSAANLDDAYVEIKYDTTAIDSFSNGAISVDVANEIRRSSKVYQDSLRAVAQALEQQKKEMELKAKEDQLKKEEIKKGTEAKKAEAKTGPKPESSPAQNSN